MSLAETALLVLGVCAVVAFLASLLWRSMGRRRELRVAREKLGSPNLATRDAGLNLALGAGLHASAPMLLQAVSDSPDEKFLAHVASLVNQRQWEPITSSQMDVLRTWAAEFATSVQDDVPRQRVLVTGAGGPAGVNLIKTLAAGGHFTIGVDPDPLAVGLYLSDEGETGLVADDSGNAQRILEVGIRHGATMLISTVSEEMSGLSAISSSLDAAGISHWLPTPDAVDSCIDKWRFAQVLLASGVKHPASSVGLDGSEVARSVPAPWIVKPRFGRGSRGVVSVDGLEELVSVLAHADSPITQTRLSGREFTADTLVDRDGTMAACVPRYRLETKAGISTKGRTFENSDVVQMVQASVEAVGLFGVANVQGFVADDGRVTITEINPRFSGGLMLSIGAGCHIVDEYVRAVAGLSVRPDRLRADPGVIMLRYFEETFTRAY